MLLSVKVVTMPPRGISSPGNSILRYTNCIISPATIGLVCRAKTAELKPKAVVQLHLQAWDTTHSTLSGATCHPAPQQSAEYVDKPGTLTLPCRRSAMLGFSHLHKAISERKERE